MTRKDLSPEKQKEYDQIVDEIMAEIEAEQAKRPPLPPNTLSCKWASIYTKVYEKHKHRLDRLLEGK